MGRLLRCGAGFALALLVLTCKDETLTGPGRSGAAALRLPALARVAGEPPVPVDSIEITLVRRSDGSVALDSLMPFRTDTGKGDSNLVRMKVPLRESPEGFQLSVRLFGRGVNWYNGSAPVDITAGGSAAATGLVLSYVGTGAHAARVALAPLDTTIVGGTAFALRATVYDSAGAPIAGVPVGYRLGDTTQASVAYPTPYAASFTGKTTVRDSMWVVAETPTHLKDSTRVHIVPPATALQKRSGDGQASVVGSALPAPLTVRVVDALGGGFKGDTVRWTVAAGSATLAAAFSVSDDSGYASMQVTPTAIGALSVQAAVPGLSGSPVTFGETAIAGTIQSITLTPTLDTIANGTTLQYVAVAKDAGGGIVTTTFGWTSTAPAVATVSSTGLASARAGDSTRIIATAGGVADTARLFVRALRSIALAPADTVVTAVGDSLLLQPTITDNFGAPIVTGLFIRYYTASPAIATVNRLTGRVNVTGPGNGVILAFDSVASSDSLIRGSATVRVNQVTAGVVNSPQVDSVGVGGQGQIVAKALDRHGFQIPGKTFGWSSRDTRFATVNGSGVVTGVAIGSTFVVDSVDGYKDSTEVVVVSAPPRQILWTFDSTAVGNGGNVSVGLTVTQPPAGAPLSIKITSSDSTIAAANPTTVTIGSGSSATSAVIYGYKSGRAVLTATDASGLGYSSRTMTVGVVSTIDFREIASPGFRQSYFYLNQNETHKAQVWLSDPAPPGGLGITFEYARPGVSVVTPSPVVIPAGQLSADITLQGLAPGSGGQPDSVTPTSGGYIGKGSYVYVAPDSLRFNLPYPYTGTVGVGQWIQPYVSITYGMDHPLILTAALSPPIGTTQPADTIVKNNTSVSLTVAARAAGAETLTVTAPGWVAAKGLLTFTTPRLVAGGQTSIVAGSPSPGYWSATTADSLGYGHPVTDSVPVTAVSRNDKAVVIDAPSTLYVPRDQSNVSRYALRALASAGGDSSWIVLTAPGYRPDSFLVYVTKPMLTFGLGYPYDGRVAVGTQFKNAAYVNIPYAQPGDYWVVFAPSSQGRIGRPDSVMIPQGQVTAYFDITGQAVGPDTVTVLRATGYQVQGSPQVFTVDPIHVQPYGYPTTLYTISQGQYLTAIALDAVNGMARPLLSPLLVTLRPVNNKAFVLDSTTVTIPAGQYVSGPDSIRVVSVDSSRVTSSAPGSSADSSAMIHVNATPLQIQFGYPYNGYVGRGLKLPGSYVYIPAAAPNTVAVTLQRYDPLKDSISVASVLIPKGSSTSEAFEVVGLDSTGTDSITASAPGFVRARATVTPYPVSLSAQRLGPSHLTTNPAQTVYVLTQQRQGYQQNTYAPVSFSIRSSDSTVIRIDSASSLIRADSAMSIVPANQAYGYYRVRYVGNGTARIRVSAPGFAPDSTELVTVTGPSLHFATTTVTVGQGQTYPYQYVYVDNPVTVAPLVVRLTRTDSLTLPANQVFALGADSLVIPVGQTYSAPLIMTGQVVGSAQLIARASGYGQATSVVTVGVPQLVTSYKTLSLYVGAPPTAVPVYTSDQTGSSRPVSSAIVVGDTSSAPGVAVGDSATKTIVAGGTATIFNLTGVSKGSAAIAFASPGYRPDTTRVTVDTAQLMLYSDFSLSLNGTAQIYVYIPFITPVPVTVTLSALGLSVPATVTIPANDNIAYFDVTGLLAGLGVLNAKAPGFKDAATVTVLVQ